MSCGANLDVCTRTGSPREDKVRIFSITGIGVATITSIIGRRPPMPRGTLNVSCMTTATTPTNDHGKQVAVDLFRHSELEDVEDAYAEIEVGIEDLLLRP